VAVTKDGPLAKAQKVIFTSINNEAPFFIEWIAYHGAIGFDRIIVVSNDCDDETDVILSELALHRMLSHLSHRVDVGVSPQLQAARLAE
jgi:hypothetical protein